MGDIFTGGIGNDVDIIAKITDNLPMTSTPKKLGTGDGQDSSLYLGIDKVGFNEAVAMTKTSTQLNATVDFKEAITASAAELNILDGATLSTTELNYVDGVTSSIQTQIDAKASSSALSTEASTRAADDTTLAGLITTEASARSSADSTLQSNINSEASTRSTADSTLQTNIDAKVTKNADITGATKTKVTYDAKGLVTSGADATTADIADSTNKRYVTDADLVDIGNLSGTNSGDNAANSLYSGLVSNATHTGEVTGSGALTVDKTAITNKTAVTPATDDYILGSDTSDSGNLKKFLISDLPGGSSTSIEIITATLGSTQNDYAISGINTSKNVLTVFRITPSSSFKLTGLSSTGLDDGKRIRIYNNSDPLLSGARIIICERNSALSASTNRLLSPIYGSFPPIITPQQYLDFEYQSAITSFVLVAASDWGNPNGFFDTYSDCHAQAPFISDTATSGSIGTTSSNTLSGTVQKSVGTLLHTLTTNAGRAYLGTQAAAMYLGTGAALGMARVVFLSLADATDDYVSYNLFTDAGATASDQVGFIYNRSSSTDWRTSTVNNGTELAKTVTGFTPSTTVFHVIGAFINGDGTNVDFFYSTDGETWTFAASHASTGESVNGSIPTGTARTLGFRTGFTKTAGGGSKTMATDWLGFKLMFKRGV